MKLNLWLILLLHIVIIDSQALKKHLSLSTSDEGDWYLTSTDRFGLLATTRRRQGIAADNKGNFFYSSFTSLVYSDSLMGRIVNENFTPIPRGELPLNNHIGDIDFADDYLYVPIEDEENFLYPRVGVYFAYNLTLNKYFSLPLELQPDGVPYVCVDSANKVAYTSQYSNVTNMNVYDMETFDFVKQIPLSMTLDSIQGASVYNGYLYVTASSPDGDKHSVYRINLSDNAGFVIEVVNFSGDDDFGEIEGITFTSTTYSASNSNTAYNVDKMYVMGMQSKGSLRDCAIYTFQQFQ